MQSPQNVQVVVDSAVAAYTERFGGDPTGVAIAPGRVNLIGEHTDYNEGFVFPVAVDRFIAVAYSAAREGEATLLHSTSQSEPSQFNALTVCPGEVMSWGAYAAGMAWVLRESTGNPAPNLRAAVTSNLPMGSGVSSSAALEVAFGVVWNAAMNLRLPNNRIAHLSQRCEREFVGVNCGIMDMMASAMGVEDHALLLDTRTLEITYAPLPVDLAIVLCDTQTPRTLAGSAYNQRRAECEEACRTLGVPALRDATVEDLARFSGTVLKRARHVFTENARCLEFAGALKRNDYRVLGLLMEQSHVSLRDDYEVSSLALDTMRECAGNSTGCIGVRMTGAGFGGACVALVSRESVFTFVEETGRTYKAHGLGTPQFAVLKAVRGASCHEFHQKHP